MGETTPQDRQTATTRHPTPPHQSLRTSALSFIAAQSHNPSLPSLIDYASLRRLVTPQYTHTFGPAYFVSQNAKLQGAFTIDAFIEHLSGMTARLRRWEIEIKRVVVEEEDNGDAVGSVVVKVGYGMFVEGCEERVENEVVWWLDLEREREGEREWRVSKSLEIVDAVAAGRVRELMTGMKESAAAGVAGEGD